MSDLSRIVHTEGRARKPVPTRRTFLRTLAAVATVALVPTAVPASPPSSPDLETLRHFAAPERPIPQEHAGVVLDVAICALSAVERERGRFDPEAFALYERILARVRAGLGRGVTLGDLRGIRDLPGWGGAP